MRIHIIDRSSNYLMVSINKEWKFILIPRCKYEYCNVKKKHGDKWNPDKLVKWYMDFVIKIFVFTIELKLVNRKRKNK